ncbi:hypothetical protein D3C81_10520 [compost metagenome]
MSYITRIKRGILAIDKKLEKGPRNILTRGITALFILPMLILSLLDNDEEIETKKITRKPNKRKKK